MLDGELPMEELLPMEGLVTIRDEIESLKVIDHPRPTHAR